jgi:hypothetical protein
LSKYKVLIDYAKKSVKLTTPEGKEMEFVVEPVVTGKGVNQILEDMLRACALQYGRSWDKSPPYAEFSYNNSYQESLKMAPFEMLYGRRCRTPLFWNETREQKVFGPDILQKAEKQVRMVRGNLRVEQTRQKSYADHRRRVKL